MKKLFFAFYLIALAFVATSCDKDSDSIPEREEKSNESNNPILPTEDQMTETLELNTAVIGNSFDNLSQALISRLSKPQNGIDQETMVAFYDNDDFMNDPESPLFLGAMNILDRGGVLIFSNPTSEIAEGAEMYAYSKKGNYCFLQKSGASNEEDIEISTDTKSGISTHRVLTKSNDQTYEPTPYSLGLRADVIAKFVTEECLQTNASNSNDLSAQKFVYHYEVDNRNMTPRTYNKAPYQVTYFVTALYSFDHKEDYYLVHQEVIGSNSPVSGCYWDDTHLGIKPARYFAGFELGEYETESWLRDSDGQNLTRYTNEIHDPSPQTTQSSASFTSGISFNIGGSIGTSGAAIVPGASFSQSSTITIPDVTTINRTYEASGIYDSNGNFANAFWTYNVRKRESKWQLIGMGFTDPPKVAVSSIVLHNYWYWAVPIKTSSDTYRIFTRNSICFTHTLAWEDYFFHSDYKHTTEGKRYNHTLYIKPPIRIE